MSRSLVAVDIGNTFLHLARYAREMTGPVDDRTARLPLPPTVAWADRSAPHLARAADQDDKILSLLPAEPVDWFVTSVHRGREASLIEWIRLARPDDSCRVLRWIDYGLALDVEYPDRVGRDRLAAALAANWLRPPGRAAIIVDGGTALTVDLVDEDGVFRGGAIACGTRLWADALHEFTDALPRVAPPTEAPPAIGRDTESAIASGLYYGARGAVRELVRAVAEGLSRPPMLIVTGGNGWHEALADWQPLVVPDLVVAGTALAAYRLQEIEVRPIVSASGVSTQPTAEGDNHGGDVR